MKIHVRCNPPTSLSKNSKQLFVRGGVPGMTDSKNTKAAKDTILQLLVPYAPKTPFEGALGLVVEFEYPFPKSAPKRVLSQRSMDKLSRPDVDGIASGVMDCMTTLRFWNDDAQVVKLTVSKRLSLEPGIAIMLEERNG